MRCSHPLSTLFITAGLAVAVVLLPSCRRGPEEQPAPTPVPPGAEAPLAGLELPQQNPDIGISLSAVPAGLVVTYNSEHWIELTDSHRSSLRYTFIEAVPDSPGISPTNVGGFEASINTYPDGEVLDRGSVETVFGTADWSDGTYSEDGEVIDDLRLFAAHPSGSGTLILRSTCPVGVASVEDRLSVMQALLANVS